MTVTIEDRRQRPRGRPRRDGADRDAFTFQHWSALGAPTDQPEPKPVASPVRVGGGERLLAFLMLLGVTPMMLLIAIGVKLTSPGGPVLFRQERVGLDRRRSVEPDPSFTGERDRRRKLAPGRPFTMYKFRTMVPDAEKATGPIWATKQDSRITPLGGVLRHLRLDELPQLINVVRGDMSLIGPRPERPFFVDGFTGQIPEYATRLRVPPGITGLAQVEREYDESVDDVKRKLKYDIYYVKNRSMVLNAKIMIKTIDVMLRGRGAH